MLVLELIGTVAFAISGAFVAIERKMDILGVIVLGLTTAIGGGFIRDLVIGQVPPVMFRNPVYAAVAVLTSLIVFIPAVRQFLSRHKHFDRLLLVMDSIGLGIFTAVGISAAFRLQSGFVLTLFVGVITGVGGGLMRDVFAGVLPSIFVRHFYACASMLGALSGYFCQRIFANETLSLTVCVILTFILRIFAAHFRWSLPKAE